MKPETTEDILELMNGYIVSAVLGTAMELGIFWLLADKPLSAPELAQYLNIPLNRCHYWLQILCKLGLLEDSGEGYAPSTIAREAILNVQSQDTWTFQAREDRELSLYVRDLALNISKPMSAWQACNLTPADYFQQIEEDPITWHALRASSTKFTVHSQNNWQTCLTYGESNGCWTWVVVQASCHLLFSANVTS